eukprot:TRINITY_DN18716_c0_g1_i6.p1 TRINITY_DN18716_c0_g1~~TRINITY_DN18716_c0_g1_i6.p1  ORF type:complete len:407 (+),score=69.34 TRINITY_DN18716_c0_g1_i6:97-1221(+)
MLRSLVGSEMCIRDRVRSAEQQRCNPSPSYQLLSEKVGCQLTSPRQCRLPKLAYVVPYAKHEVEQVLLLLRMWQLASYQPCQQCVNADLILAGANQQAVATLVEARGRDKTSPYCIGRSCTGPSQGHCWRDIFDLDLQLPDKYDRYGAGPPNMFRMLFSSDVMGRRGYTAMFWGEPDTFPVRAGWLDGLFRKAIDMHHGPWWELGTVQSFVRRNQNNADRFLWHTNGNALYRYDSPAFAEFVSQAIPEGMEGAFDTSLYEHRFGESKWGLSRKLPLLAHTNIHLLHRFGYTEAVKNHPQDLCMPNLKNWTERWPGVFLVHSKAFGALLKCSRCCETSSDGFFRATKLATGVLSAGMRCLYESHEEPHHGPTQLC